MVRQTDWQTEDHKWDASRKKFLYIVRYLTTEASFDSQHIKAVWKKWRTRSVDYVEMCVFVLHQHVQSCLWHTLVGGTSVKMFEVAVTPQEDFISSGHQCGTSCIAVCRCVLSFICEVPFQLRFYFTRYKVQKGDSLRLWMYSIQLCVYLWDLAFQAGRSS